MGVTIARIEGLKIRRLAFAAVISRFPRRPTIASSAWRAQVSGIWMTISNDRLCYVKERSGVCRRVYEKMESLESVRFDENDGSCQEVSVLNERGGWTTLV